MGTSLLASHGAGDAAEVEPTPRPPLTVEDILSWADAHKARRGHWPKMGDGKIRAGPLRTTWRQVDNALRLGLRGLPGGSSLARLLAKHRGYRNVHGLPPLTEDLILRWAEDHVHRTDKWPTENAGPVLDAPGETWGNVNEVLRAGLRGFPGGDSIAKLLYRRRRVRTKAAVPPLTVPLILQWADTYHEQHGDWPLNGSGSIPAVLGETWAKVDVALQLGRRGLPGGSSLAELLHRRRGVRNVRRPPRLTHHRILFWADSHLDRTGKWPTASSGKVANAEGETWRAVNLALFQGLRGLPGGR